MTVDEEAGPATLGAAVANLPSWCPTPRERADLDLLQTGGYDPLPGFMGRASVRCVRDRGRLSDGTPWPVPVTLHVDPEIGLRARASGRLALTDEDGTRLAVVEVGGTWPDGEGVAVAGRVRGISTSAAWDFPQLRLPIRQVRQESAGSGRHVLCVQPHGPVDTRTTARWVRAADALDADLLILPAIPRGPERRQLARIRAYRRLLDDLPDGTRLRLFGCERDPRERSTVELHAVVARNAGATHLVRGDSARSSELTRLGLTPVELTAFASPSDPRAGELGDAVADEVRRGDPPRDERGFVVLLTGLSGSGKSTVAQALRARLVETGDRQVTLLDGDLVRRNLSSELGFSREHRDLNVRRIGYVAAEIAKHGGIAVCAPIAPYDRTRRAVRDQVTALGGGFVLVHVATPLSVCEQRDVKGLYARARAGKLTGFTGIDDPYEVPIDADLTIDTSGVDPLGAADQIVATLARGGWIAR